MKKLVLIVIVLVISLFLSASSSLAEPESERNSDEIVTFAISSISDCGLRLEINVDVDPDVSLFDDEIVEGILRHILDFAQKICPNGNPSGIRTELYIELHQKGKNFPRMRGMGASEMAVFAGMVIRAAEWPSPQEELFWARYHNQAIIKRLREIEKKKQRKLLLGEN